MNELTKVMRGCNFRVPKRNGCLTDLILNVKIPVTEAIHDAFKQAAQGKVKKHPSNT